MIHTYKEGILEELGTIVYYYFWVGLLFSAFIFFLKKPRSKKLC